jgi:N-acetylglucosamine-6-phosphate deacetylase
VVGPGQDIPDLVLGGRVVAPGRVITDGLVAVAGAKIVWVGSAADAPLAQWPVAQRTGATLLPGLIDVHCHGGAGSSFPNGDLAGSLTAAEHHLRHGTTGLVASLVTADEPVMISALATCADLVDQDRLVGIHLEGPFLSSVRCGAQDPDFMLAPDELVLARLLEAGRGHVVSMTYAAELPGSPSLVRQLAASGVIACLGHTDADFATAGASIALAASNARSGRAAVTHLFNGMRAFHHRDPGPVAASLVAASRGQAVLELVADGVHLADATVATVFELVGPGSIALVTDAMAAAGRPDGRYRLGTRDVVVADGVARLVGSDGEPGPLAGGIARLLDVVRRCVQFAGIDLEAAVEAASATPARLLGIDHLRGSLSVGHRADVVAVDDDLAPLAVWSAGRRV